MNSFTSVVAGKIFQAVQAAKRQAEADASQRVVERIQVMVQNQISATMTEMALTMDGAISSSRMKFNNPWVGGYTYRDMKPDTLIEKQHLSGQMADLPYKMTDYYKRRSESLVSLIERLAAQGDIGRKLFDLFGGFTAEDTQTRTRQININRDYYDRHAQRRDKTRRRWSEVVPPEVLRQIKSGKRKVVTIDGYITSSGDYFYDVENRRTMSIQRAIAENRIKSEVRVSVQGAFFKAVELNEYGFLMAMSGLIQNQTAGQKNLDKLNNLRKQQRNVLDPFFGDMLEIIAERIDDGDY